jgi:hypothetical protein
VNGPDEMITGQFPPDHPVAIEYKINVAKMERTIGKSLSDRARGILAIAALSHFAFVSAMTDGTPDAETDARQAFTMMLAGLWKFTAITEVESGPTTAKAGFGFDTTRVQREN